MIGIKLEFGGRLRDNGCRFALLIDPDHPIVQTAIRVPHDVVQDDQFLQLLAEGLSQGIGPEESPLAGRLLVRIGLVISLGLVV